MNGKNPDPSNLLASQLFPLQYILICCYVRENGDHASASTEIKQVCVSSLA